MQGFQAWAALNVINYRMISGDHTLEARMEDIAAG